MPPVKIIMKIITWNINSVRLRLPSLLRLLAEAKPEVVCLQETKCPDHAFPRAALAEAGYRHQAIRGEKGVNGVAILSRLPLVDVHHQHWAGRADCRHIAAFIDGGGGSESNKILLDNFYVPAGGDIPDTKQNPKFAHKLKFLAELQDWARKRNATTSAVPAVLVGDLNIAPREDDVWSHKALLSVVSHTPREVEALLSLQEAGRWVDAVRHHIPDGKLYSWWSYRARVWEESDRGRRLDHIWVTPPLVSQVKQAEIMKHVRGWEQPSDHAPVVVTLVPPAKNGSIA